MNTYTLDRDKFGNIAHVIKCTILPHLSPIQGIYICKLYFCSFEEAKIFSETRYVKLINKYLESNLVFLFFFNIGHFELKCLSFQVYFSQIVNCCMNNFRIM